MYTKPPVVLLYGLDETCQPFEVEATTSLVKSAYEALRSHGWRVEAVKLSHDLTTPLKPYDPHEWIVLNLCEGAPSQDYYYARVARMLSAHSYTYTGSDFHCLDRTQFKAQMKQVMEDYGVPTPRWGVFSSPDEVAFDVFPAIVKPASEHCSFGITRDSVVMSLEEARAQVARIKRDHKCPALVEEFLDSPEYNVTVWGFDTGNPNDVSVVGISTMTYDAFNDIHDRLCTFEAKWEPASMAYQQIPAICPAPVSAALKAELERVAIGAYRAAGCRDYGRVDIRLSYDQPMALDINANCDVSPDSGFANAARSQGLTYADAIEQLVLFAMRRHTNAYVPLADWRAAASMSMPAVAR
jgi:D-alanine-D-alanine ligase